MSNATPTPAGPTGGPRATVCPEPGCHVLVPATTEDRREHRAGHLHTAKVERAIRAELQAIRALAGEIRGEHAALKRSLDSIEIPDPVEPMRIEDWPEDELAEPAEELLADDDDDLPPLSDGRAGEPDEDDPAADDDDLDDDAIEIPARRF